MHHQGIGDIMIVAYRKQAALMIVAFIAGNISGWLFYNYLVEESLKHGLSNVYVYKGMIYSKSKQLKEAIESYHTSHLYNSLNYEPLLGLAQAYSNANCDKLAIEYYSMALKILSANNVSRVDRYIAQKELAYIMLKQGEYKEAVEYLLALEEEYEVEVEILFYIGLAYSNLNNFSDSRKYLELYLSKAGKDSPNEMSVAARDIISKNY